MRGFNYKCERIDYHGHNYTNCEQHQSLSLASLCLLAFFVLIFGLLPSFLIIVHIFSLEIL